MKDRERCNAEIDGWFCYLDKGHTGKHLAVKDVVDEKDGGISSSAFLLKEWDNDSTET